jgi:GTP cyclohydrolase IA
MISKEAERVRVALLAAGLENPMIDNGLTESQKIGRVQDLMTEIVSVLGLNIEDESLRDTPKRIAKMYVQELFSGLDYQKFPDISQIDNTMGIDEPVYIDNIALLSTCEHHFITIDGTATVAYLPQKRVIGLSKINRIVAFFAQRPQVQERLNRQIMVALQTLLETDDVAVSIHATHYCVKARGIKDSQSRTQTKSLGGVFKRDPIMRAEFVARLVPALEGR